MNPRLHVLIIEDDPDDAELLKLELERDGFEVISARVQSEIELRAALTAEPWDIVLSDFAMPGFDGLRAFQIVQEQKLDVPFIFVSGALGEERAVSAMRAGARDYLLKSSLGRLNVAVRRELEQAEVRQAQYAAEEVAERQQRRLAMAVHASGAGIFEYWTEGEPERGDVAYVSHRWAEILGEERAAVPRSRAFGNWILERIHPDDKEPTLATIQRFFADGSASRCRCETRLRHADGHQVPVEISMEAISRGADGRARHVGGVMIDLTERQRLEEQLRHAQKMEGIGRLAGGIAHDFNNLLTAILSFGDFVLGELEVGSLAEQDMQEVITAAGRAATLTGQLLAFSRQKPVSPQVINLNDVLGQMERMLRRLLREDIALKVSMAHNLWNVRCDAGAIEQVMVNLVINAKDAMPDGGSIRITTRNVELTEKISASEDPPILPGDYVAIEVADAGTGMDAETREHIFEPFFTTKQPGHGTGLGLSTCYGIVRQAEGHIEVDSELGRGTTFRVLLPRVCERTEEANGPRATEDVRGHETVLVVEDDDSVRLLVTRTLSRHGYAVAEAHDGASALEWCREHGESLDLLLTDMMMPGLRGDELAGQLAPEHPALPVLYMSGYSADGLSRAPTLDRLHGLLQKPFTPQQLLRQVRQFLDATRSRAEIEPTS